MHLGGETLGLIGIHYPYYSFVLGYPDVLDPYFCAWGTVWNGSAKRTSILCPRGIMLGGFSPTTSYVSMGIASGWLNVTALLWKL